MCVCKWREVGGGVCVVCTVGERCLCSVCEYVHVKCACNWREFMCRVVDAVLCYRGLR